MKKNIVLILFTLCFYTLSAQDFGKGTPIEVVEQESVATVGNRADTVRQTTIRKTATIYYRFDRSEIDSSYMTNQEVLDFIDEQLTDPKMLSNIDSLSIHSISSPEGPLTYNQALSQRRVDSFGRYLSEKYPAIAPKIKKGRLGEEWDNLREMVAHSTKIPSKDEVLAIIDSDLPLDTKEYRLKHLGDGSPWQFIVYNMLRYMRYGGTAMFYYKRPQFADVMEPEINFASTLETIPVKNIVACKDPLQIAPQPIYERKPIMAFKTNMVYDLMTVLNISAEVPINERISLAGEWTFPWWIWDNGEIDSKRHRIQQLQASFEARYWFGDVYNRPIMTGWFAGPYCSSGKFDFEHSRDGIQGEYYSAGLSAGYAHSINKKHTLRLEYSASAGYVHSDYRDYNTIYADTFDDRWHPIRRTTGEFSALLPTSVKVSLVWMLYYNKRVKGVYKW